MPGHCAFRGPNFPAPHWSATDDDWCTCTCCQYALELIGIPSQHLLTATALQMLPFMQQQQPPSLQPTTALQLQPPNLLNLQLQPLAGPAPACPALSVPQPPRLAAPRAAISHNGTHSQGATKGYYFNQLLLQGSGLHVVLEYSNLHQDCRGDGAFLDKDGYDAVLRAGGGTPLQRICCSIGEMKTTGVDGAFHTSWQQLVFWEERLVPGYVLFIWAHDLALDAYTGAQFYGRLPSLVALQQMLAGARGALVPVQSLLDHFEASEAADGLCITGLTLATLPGYWGFDPFDPMQAREAVYRLIGGATWWEAHGRSALAAGVLPPFRHPAFLLFYTHGNETSNATGDIQFLGKSALAQLGYTVRELIGPGGAGSGMVIDTPRDNPYISPDLIPANSFGIEIRIGGSVRSDNSLVDMCIAHDTGDGLFITKELGCVAAVVVVLPGGRLCIGSRRDWERLTDGGRASSVAVPIEFRALNIHSHDFSSDALAARLRVADLQVDPADRYTAQVQVAIALGLRTAPRVPPGGVPCVLLHPGYAVGDMAYSSRFRVKVKVPAGALGARQRDTYFSYGPRSGSSKEQARAEAEEFALVAWREVHGVRGEAEELLFWS